MQSWRLWAYGAPLCLQQLGDRLWRTETLGQGDGGKPKAAAIGAREGSASEDQVPHRLPWLMRLTRPRKRPCCGRPTFSKHLPKAVRCNQP